MECFQDEAALLQRHPGHRVRSGWTDQRWQFSVDGGNVRPDGRTLDFDRADDDVAFARRRGGDERTAVRDRWLQWPRASPHRRSIQPRDASLEGGSCPSTDYSAAPYGNPTLPYLNYHSLRRVVETFKDCKSFAFNYNSSVFR
jgi:hypothetical protein